MIQVIKLFLKLSLSTLREQYLLGNASLYSITSKANLNVKSIFFMYPNSSNKLIQNSILQAENEAYYELNNWPSPS